ncbi:MAG TPA: SMP-30/gluconolactonase/LRE family protein [Polyangiaceae bacterium]|nr:SMP-30/gluconolactonase/LRE family protein [Polyangiaceae bacterium]
MKNRISRIRTSAQVTLVAGFCFACGGQTPPAEAPAAEPAPAEPAPAAAPEPPPPPPGPVVIKDVGLQVPESVLHDVTSDTYLVSNINGSPLDKDDNGFISKLSPEGQVVALKWIDGAAADVELNAPKGMGISNGKLYVADIDVIRTFDAATGKPGQQIKVAGAAFLNDVTVAPDGTVYVSDTGLKAGKDGQLEPNKKDAIYKVTPQGKVAPLIKGEQLGLPNGLFADATGLWVATWQGALYHVTPDGKQEAPLKAPGAQLDGLIQTAEGQVLFSSWEKSAVFVGSTDGQFSPLLSDVKAPADIGYDSKRGQVLVPLFTENTIEIVKLPAAAASAEPAPSNATAEVK